MLADQGLEPVLDAQCRLLILGSLPGKASIACQQYYGHPRNAFWYILESLLAIDAKASYQKRLALLKSKRLGLWDVYATAPRKGSLDSAIELAKAQANDFLHLFETCPDIQAIAFNGALAYQQFLKLKLDVCDKALLALPSTSPAYAAMPYSEKVNRWRDILPYVQA